MPAVIVVSYLSLLMLGLLDNVRGPLFPDIVGELLLSGTAGAGFYAIAALTAFAASWTSHRALRGRDPLAVLAFASVVFALGVFVIAWSGTYLALMFGAGVFGWGYGTLNVLQNVIVCEAAQPQLRRRYLNGLQSMYGLSALVAPLAATGLRALHMDWRQVFFLLAFLPLLAAVPAWRYRGKVHTIDDVKTGPEWSREDRWACAGFAILLSVYLWGELSVSTRLVLWLRTQQGFSPEAADSQLALFFLLLLVGRLALAFIAMPKISNWMILSFSAFSSAVFYGLALLHSPSWLALCGLTMAPFYPVIMDQAALSFGAKAPRVVGIVIGVGNLSIMSMHLAVGLLTDLFDLSRALFVGPVALILVGMALIWVQVKGRRALTP